MLGLEKLTLGKEGISLKKAHQILWKSHELFLPIVDKEGNLKSLVTRVDIDKNEEYPLATKDKKGKLRVLFAVETWENPGYERLEACFAAGADGVIIDTSQGYMIYEDNMIDYILEKYPEKLLIGGNISTAEAARHLNGKKVHAYRCGQGSGSICTTAGAIGISRSGAVAVYDCSKAVRWKPAKTIADGGIRQVGDIFKALTLGADAVMLGKLLAGTEESPGEEFLDPDSGLLVKAYRGMGSKEVIDSDNKMRGYSRLPQGVSGTVPYRGSVHDQIPLMRDGLLSAFEVIDCASIKELHRRTYDGNIRFERRSEGSLREAEVNIKTRGT
jgi:IMP dehydrogenase